MKQQILIVLGGDEYEVKPSFDTMERIEQKFSLLEFLGTVQANKTKFSQVAWILYSVLMSSGHKMGYQEVGDLVMEDMPSATVYATQVITEMLGSGPAKQIKKKAKSENGPE